MRQNLYDDPSFFSGYKRMRDESRGLHELVIGPCLADLLPAIADRRLVDLDCGDGWFWWYAARTGAAHVIGVDPSARKLDLARERTSDDRITYVQAFAEDAAFPEASVDVVVSILALHYMADLELVLRSVAAWLAAGGTFVEIVEHPIFTSQLVRSGWITEEGQHVAWPVSDYFNEGERNTTWFVDGGRPVPPQRLDNHQPAQRSRTDNRSHGGAATQPALETNPDSSDELIRPAVLAVRAVKGRP